MIPLPTVGSLVRPCGGEVSYRVVSVTTCGCYVEATTSTTPTVAGRQSRALRYDEKRYLLAWSVTSGLFDARWRKWEVTSCG